MSTEFPWNLLSLELITEILTRLPAKPLARFKCVSKTYNSLISHPHFLKSYNSKPSQSNWVILDRLPKLSNESTQFNLVNPPKVSTFSINPRKLVPQPSTDWTNFGSQIIQSSNGFLLFNLMIEFGQVLVQNYFHLVNTVTNQWVPLPKPRKPIEGFNLAFKTTLDPETGLVDKFLVVEYHPVVGTDSANLMCFESDVGNWVEKSANYMLGSHVWSPTAAFEYDGRIIWVDISVGLITWDGVECVKETAVCRFIPLPSRRAKPFDTTELAGEPCTGIGGGFFQYMEMFKKGKFVFKLWRLKNCESGEWVLLYKLSHNWFEKMLPPAVRIWTPNPSFVHPLKSDVVYFGTGRSVVSLNVRTRKIESCTDLTANMFVYPMLLPNWPSPFPKRLYAAYAKEEGNECFKRMNFSDAIKCYSKSIGLSPNAVAFANRAMSYLKVNKFQEAENDCTESLKLDPSYFKVYWRRALARKELGYLKEALDDVEVGLTLEPENKELKKLCAELNSTLDKESCEGREYGQKGLA